MRQILKGLVAAVAVMAAAPAMACGYAPCAAPVYVAPVVTYGYGYNRPHRYYHGHRYSYSGRYYHGRPVLRRYY